MRGVRSSTGMGTGRGSRAASRPNGPKRVVSLVPSVTETLCEFGLAERIIGVTRYCVSPARSLRKKARIGGPLDPSLKKILSLKPDLVIAGDEENRREDVEALVRRGIPVRVCRVRSVAGAIAMMRFLAALWPGLSRPGEIIRETESLRRALGAAPTHRGTRVACLVWKRPYMSCGGDTYIGDLIETCGGENVFHGQRKRYFALTLEKLAAARPELVLLPTEPYRFRRKDREELLAFLRRRGLKGCRARIVRGEMLAWHGARTRVALAKLPAVISGERD